MSQLKVTRAGMHRNEEGHFVGYAVFSAEGHVSAYEITFLSKDGRDWDYSLNFAGEPGPEEQFLKIDSLIEEDDELFDDLLDAAIDAGGMG
ncbi:hypothetical protein [Paenibacillus sp. DMB20]|uniref:hypothetical protein n=1 Tax=Paenibacillus sp. DMB20 TaxID=1642570 RepID=UPI000628125D|nr:hypothetical protein [Paenibacillus sp. DMB20]KKO55274.1 hypothetical protein XI25_01795 [Paenibacillus sp. DMB20]